MNECMYYKQTYTYKYIYLCRGQILKNFLFCKKKFLAKNLVPSNSALRLKFKIIGSTKNNSLAEKKFPLMIP